MLLCKNCIWKGGSEKYNVLRIVKRGIKVLIVNKVSFESAKILLRSIFSDNNTLNINYSILQSTIYTFFNEFNTKSCLNRYDKMRPLFFKIAPGHFRA